MNKILSNYEEIIKQIELCKNKFAHKYDNPELIAVSKRFSKDKIQNLVDIGHRTFGENQVQEAHSKWIDLKKENEEKKLELHLIGPLQSNKVKLALDVFDVIQTLDREKVAIKIQKYLEEVNAVNSKKFLIQVNIGEEKQKSGLEINATKQFFEWCFEDLKLNIIGLMCIPPINKSSGPFFKKLRNLCDELNLKHASMGMTNDFKSAIQHGATFIRIGTGIFGARD